MGKRFKRPSIKKIHDNKQACEKMFNIIIRAMQIKTIMRTLHAFLNG